jgi:hypothetical protein
VTHTVYTPEPCLTTSYQPRSCLCTAIMPQGSQGRSDTRLASGLCLLQRGARSVKAGRPTALRTPSGVILASARVIPGLALPGRAWRNPKHIEQSARARKDPPSPSRSARLAPFPLTPLCARPRALRSPHFLPRAGRLPLSTALRLATLALDVCERLFPTTRGLFSTHARLTLAGFLSLSQTRARGVEPRHAKGPEPTCTPAGQQPSANKPGTR